MAHENNSKNNLTKHEIIKIKYKTTQTDTKQNKPKKNMQNTYKPKTNKTNKNKYIKQGKHK